VSFAPKMPLFAQSGSRRQAVADAIIGSALIIAVAISAVVVKELTSKRGTPPLAMIDSAEAPDAATTLPPIVDPLVALESLAAGAGAAFDAGRYELDTSTRYFNGRPVRPARTMWMTVTGYSPDWRSCGDSADDITASNHHVQTNNYRLVAADTRLLPLGSMISIPGYSENDVVPVLDRGGAIKGNRLDLLFPTHEQARQWGVKKLRVVVWEYADGKPADDYRKVRDAK
jgi:3D (Asp-Asp-Asp) domain-containing protein